MLVETSLNYFMFNNVGAISVRFVFLARDSLYSAIKFCLYLSGIFFLLLLTLRDLVWVPFPMIHPFIIQLPLITLKTSTNITRYLYSRGPVFLQCTSDKFD